MIILGTYDPANFNNNPDEIEEGLHDLKDLVERVTKHLKGATLMLIPTAHHQKLGQALFQAAFAFSIVRKPHHDDIRYYILKNRNSTDDADELVHADKLYNMLIKEHQLWTNKQQEEKDEHNKTHG